MEDAELSRPTKRQKTSAEENAPNTPEISMQETMSDPWTKAQETQNTDELKEQAIGVKAFVTPGPLKVESGSSSRYTFRGVLKKR